MIPFYDSLPCASSFFLLLPISLVLCALFARIAYELQLNSNRIRSCDSKMKIFKMLRHDASKRWGFYCRHFFVVRIKVFRMRLPMPYRRRSHSKYLVPRAEKSYRFGCGTGFRLRGKGKSFDTFLCVFVCVCRGPTWKWTNRQQFVHTQPTTLPCHPPATSPQVLVQ